MSQIIVKRDPAIELPEIAIQLHATDSSEVNDPENMGVVMQSKITGILYPLVAINGIALDYNDVEYLEFNCFNAVPVLGFIINDRRYQFSQLAAPGTTNEIQLQILPAFDNAYKKINMLFYIDKVSINNGKIQGTAIYKCKEFIKSQFKCFGKINTYELFDKISLETGLGFASNVDDVDDARFIYCDHKSYLKMIQSEIKTSMADETHVYDWWIDLWNNLILCDIFDRYNSDDDMSANKIWISESNIAGSMNDDYNPIQTEPIFSNHYSLNGTDLYISNYKIITDTSKNFFKGTQLVVSAYNDETKEYVDHIIGDGDLNEQDDDFIKFEYLGEFYGGYNYLVAEQCRNMYLRKMNTEIIEIVLQQPLLSIMKGEQIRIVWYDNDAQNVINRKAVDQIGLTPQDQLDIGWLKEFDSENSQDLDSPMILNLQVSGQYTVIGTFLIYDEGTWKYVLRLTRPASKKIQIIPEDVS